MKLRAVVFFSLCIALLQSNADEWPESSGMHHAIKQKEAQNDARGKLNERFNALLLEIEALDKQKKFFALNPALLVQELKASQTAWLEFSRAHCAAEGMATQAGSAWQNARAHECETELIEDRTNELENISRKIREGALIF